MKITFLYRSLCKYCSYNLLKLFTMTLLLVLGNAAMAFEWEPASEVESAVVLDTTLNMLCFPPTDPQNTPPCPLALTLL